MVVKVEELEFEEGWEGLCFFGGGATSEESDGAVSGMLSYTMLLEVRVVHRRDRVQ